MVRVATSALAMATLLAACDRKQADSTPTEPSAAPSVVSVDRSKVLAKVGDRTITLGDYAEALERMDEFERLRYQTKDRRRQLLDEMIDVELLAREAERRGLDQRPETQELLRQFLRDEVLRKLRDELPSVDELPEQDVRRYYDEHQPDFADPERRRVSVIAVGSKVLAEKLLGEAKTASPEAWGDLVKRHSLKGRKPQPEGERTARPPKELAGDLGIVGPPGDERGDNPQVPPAVREAVFTLKELGDLYPDVVGAGGLFYVVRLMGKTAARQRAFDEADRTIRVRLLQAKLHEAERQLEQRLREETKIEIDQAALAKVKLPAAAEAGQQAD